MWLADSGIIARNAPRPACVARGKHSRSGAAGSARHRVALGELAGTTEKLISDVSTSHADEATPKRLHLEGAG
ncbi:MAG: hypothetical protein K0S37_1100 [Microbacterium sp.]|jgi:hypothetical protein|nr:hypothetical protein [Microbacterium sp.]